MEGIPTGDIQQKYQKLALEYTKLKTHIKVLKKGVLDEQAKSAELRDLLKEKEKSTRKSELEIDSLTFRNQQLTKRISVLQDELELLHQKSSKKGKSKADDRTVTMGHSTFPVGEIMQEELQKKILENAQYASELSDRTFEVSQLKVRVEDLEKSITENDVKYKCEIMKLKNVNQDLHYTIDTMISKDKNTNCHSTPHKNFAASASNHQIPGLNGDFVSEGGSLIGSEDALSSVDDGPLNEHLYLRTHNLEQDNQKLKMEYEILKLENETLRLANQKLSVSTDKRNKNSECLDSGDFNNLTSLTLTNDGVVTCLLGRMTVPFVMNEEVQQREEYIKTYFKNKVTALTVEKQSSDSMVEHLNSQCETLRIRLEEAEKEKESADKIVVVTHETISKLEDELHSTSSNYEQQLGLLTEHVGDLNDKLSLQFEQIQTLKASLGRKK